MLKEKLQIIIITYNRKKTLENTLKSVLNNDFFGKCDILILDNASTDGTSELIQEYCSNYPNLTHIRHQINIGGNANTCRAFEIASTCNKEYFWILCDDDEYNFSNEEDIENLMNSKVDAICVERKVGLSAKNIYQTFISSATFIPALIYRTENLNSQVLQNMYLNTYTCYPHIALVIHLANNGKTFAFGNKLVTQKINLSFHRGTNDEEYFRLKNLILQIALINSYQMIKNKKLKTMCCNDIWAGKSFFKTLLRICKYYEMKSYNITDAFWGINSGQKLQLILAYIIVHLLPLNYKYLNIQLREDWTEYLNKVKEQQYIDKLSKKLKKKKIVLYGAGLLTNIILSCYDISKLNIIGVADKRFENTNDTEWNGYPIVKISEIQNKAEVVLISLKMYNSIRNKFLIKKKLDLQIYPIVKTSWFYPIETIKNKNIFFVKLKRKIHLSLCKFYAIRKIIRKKYRNSISVKNRIFSFKDIK